MSIESALSYIPPDPRERWVEIAMAIKSELGEAGFALWDRWSQQSDRYKPADAKSVWRSIRGRGITIRTLYKAARDAGWKGEEPPVSASPRPAAAADVGQDRELARARQRAAQRAAWILQQTELAPHPYLAAKGFLERAGLVWTPAEEPLLIVPMYVGKRVVNVQTITATGAKKFLTGGQAGGAEFLIGNAGMDIVCEGYATGLSVQAALTALRMKARVHVCFSAQNMKRIARGLKPGVVVADNDASHTGEEAAKAIGWRYWMSPVVGEDFNDYWRRVGLFRASQDLRATVMRPP